MCRSQENGIKIGARRYRSDFGGESASAIRIGARGISAAEKNKSVCRLDLLHPVK
jgi:hypothetical protein